MTPMQHMAESAARGKLALQCCVMCGTVQYPPRELCSACLADRFEWRTIEAEGGEVLASTALHHSHEVAFRGLLPLRVGLVRLDSGPIVVCFCSEEFVSGTRVVIAARNDAAGRGVLTATPVR
jgi:uncharacterized OB-fold protein